MISACIETHMEGYVLVLTVCVLVGTVGLQEACFGVPIYAKDGCERIPHRL